MNSMSHHTDNSTEIAALISRLRKAALSSSDLKAVMPEPARFAHILALAERGLHALSSEGLLIKQALCASPLADDPTKTFDERLQAKAVSLVKAFATVDSHLWSAR